MANFEIKQLSYMYIYLHKNLHCIILHAWDAASNILRRAHFLPVPVSHSIHTSKLYGKIHKYSQDTICNIY